MSREPDDKTPEPVTIHVCGPQSAKCKCNCPESCGHQWDGETFTSEDDRMQSATCSKCGMLAIEHDLWVLP